MAQFRPSDLFSLRAVVDAAIAPGGDEFTYTLTGPEGQSAIWRGFSKAGDPQPLTLGPRDAGARYAPDGGHIAFLRGAQGEAQVYLLDRRGGEAMPLTRLRHGVESFAWSPDGRAIATIAAVGPDGPLPIMPQEHPRRAPREFVGALLLMHLDGTWRQLSPEGLDCSHPTFSPDGRLVAFLARRTAEESPWLALAAADGGGTRRMSAEELRPGPAAFSPDGATLAFPARPHSEGPVQLFSASLADGALSTYTALPEGLMAHPRRAPAYAADGGRVYAMLSADASWRLAELDARGCRLLTPPGESVAEFSLDDAGGCVALVVEGDHRPARFELRDTVGHLLLRSRHEDSAFTGAAPIQRYLAQ